MEIYQGHIDLMDGISQVTHITRSTTVMSRCRSLGVMTDTHLGIYVQTRKHTEGLPADTIKLGPCFIINQPDIQ
ncbi:hypothetical protein ACTXT7_013442 [Hymenolepis weldensis]